MASRNPLLRSVIMAPALLVAASPMSISEPRLAIFGEAQVEKEIGTSLARMSTGTDQELLGAGTDAQSRNAAIPLSKTRLQTLSPYRAITVGMPSYSAAQRCLTQAIYYEAANESENGKRAVAQVVMNRMRHPAYPNSVCGVVYDGATRPVCQFSFTCDGSLLRKPMARQWQQSHDVAARALAGEQFSDVGTATHYHANYVLPRWAFTLDKLKVIGTHIFYRFPGAGGRSRAFTAQWSRVERIPQLDWSRFSHKDGDEFGPSHVEEHQFVKGLTVVPDKRDRHAENDVGGRLDTTKQWRLSIPDPVSASKKYSDAVAVQSDGNAESEADPGDHVATTALEEVGS